MRNACLLLLLLLTGCAGRWGRLVQSMPTYQGRPIAQVVEAWGPPATVYAEGEGKVYVWRDESVVNFGGSATLRPNGSISTTPVNTIVTQYYRMFWTDGEGRVVRWKAGRS